MLKESAEKIQQWLVTPREKWDVPAMALKLLQLNKNRILYNNILRRPEQMKDKLEYELKKQLRFHTDNQTNCSVVAMEQQLVPEVKAELDKGPVIEADDDRPAAQFRGRREDHESLPEEIQNIYVVNGDLYQRMKRVYTTLRSMDDAPACDRYEYLKMLDDLYKKYRDNWNRYDNYDPKSTSVGNAPKVVENPMDLAKKIAAARKYVSHNVKKLEKAYDEKNDRQIAELTAAVQERIDFILANEQDFKEDYKEKLIGLGFAFE